MFFLIFLPLIVDSYWLVLRNTLSDLILTDIILLNSQNCLVSCHLHNRILLIRGTKYLTNIPLTRKYDSRIQILQLNCYTKSVPFFIVLLNLFFIQTLVKVYFCLVTLIFRRNVINQYNFG